jgi:hypothetical protein
LYLNSFSNSPVTYPILLLFVLRPLNRRINLQKNTEKILEESKQKLERAQYLTKTGNWYLDNVSGSEVFSKECFNIFGLSKKDFPDNIVPQSIIMSLYANPEETAALF